MGQVGTVNWQGQVKRAGNVDWQGFCCNGLGKIFVELCTSAWDSKPTDMIASGWDGGLYSELIW